MSWNVIDPDQLGDFDLFSRCGAGERARLAALVTVERHRKNDLIVAEGAPGDRVYLVCEGSVRVSKNIPGIGEEALAILPRGSYFGEMALFGDASTRSADVYADSRATLFVIQVDELRALLEREPAVAIPFLWGAANTLAERLRAANAKVMFLSAAGVTG
jgi:CRP-like cAMP-binding protein